MSEHNRNERRPNLGVFLDFAVSGNVSKTSKNMRLSKNRQKWILWSMKLQTFLVSIYRRQTFLTSPTVYNFVTCSQLNKSYKIIESRTCQKILLSVNRFFILHISFPVNCKGSTNLTPIYTVTASKAMKYLSPIIDFSKIHFGLKKKDLYQYILRKKKSLKFW